MLPPHSTASRVAAPQEDYPALGRPGGGVFTSRSLHVCYA